MSGLEKPKSPLRDTEQSLLGPRQEKDVESGDKELAEPIRPANNMMAMPPINIREVKDMLCSPNMPEQKIMKLVASKLTARAYNSDDGGSDGESKVGMQGLFDCIIETTLCQSDHSDEDSSDDEENSPRQLPCEFCNKTFVSNMRLTTHILVMHSRQDPSLLNEKPKVVAPRRELQRSLSKGKSSSGSGDGKGRSLLHSALKVEISSATGDGGLVKHVPLRQRIKVSPKARMLPKDQVERQQSKETSNVSSLPTIAQAPSVVINASPESKPDATDTTHSQIPSSPAETGQTSEDLTSSTSQQKQAPMTESITPRPRRRSASLANANQPSSSSPSSSMLSSPLQSDSKTTRSSLRRSVDQSKASGAISPAPKRKSTDSSSEGQKSAKKANTSGKRRSSSRQSRS